MIHLPFFLKPFSGPAKAIIRYFAYFRLRNFPITQSQADWWAQIFKNWPAIYGDFPYIKRKIIQPDIFMDLGLIDVIERTLLVEGKWENHVAMAIQTCLNPGNTFLDIGANIGYFTLLASRIVGEDGKVVAIEPSKHVLAKLTTHIRINKCENVIVLSVGAGENNEIKPLYFYTPNNMGATSLLNVDSAISKEWITVFKIDDILRFFSIFPDVIKIDIEGGEFNAIKGMLNYLSSKKPIIICELIEDRLVRAGTSIKGVLRQLESLDYNAYLIEDKNGLVGKSISSNDSHFPSSQLDVIFTRQKPNFFVLE